MITNFGDEFCNLCIELMQVMAELTGFTYNTINVMLFVIIGPLISLTFAASAIFSWLKWKRLSHLCFISAIFYILIVIALILLSLCAVIIIIREV